MMIQIDDDIRIVGTEQCWELQRIRNFKGTKRWEAYQYYSTFRQALEAAGQREIRVHPAHTLADAIDAVSATVQRFEELIPSSLVDEICNKSSSDGR